MRPLWNNGRQRGKGGIREDLGNRYFRSSWEANWARFLNWQQKQGLIKSWDYECKTFEFTTVKRGCRFYTPDFRIELPDGTHEWIEVKGWNDPKSKTRAKRFAKYFPNERISTVDKKRYATVKRQVGKIIPNWE